MSLDQQGHHSADLFVKCFGKEPQHVVAAPGRVNLIGEHTDYNDGFVLPMAIERYTVLAGSRAPGSDITIHSETTGDSASFSVRGNIERGQPPWSNYVRGVVAGFKEREIKVPAFNALIHSSVPFGGGVSSSAALEVAVATLLEELTGTRLEPMEKALLCQRAEHNYAGVPCGIMDQFTSVLAKRDHALLLDCRSQTATSVRMTDPSVAVLVINSNVRHKLVDGEYASRRGQCEEAARLLGVRALRDVSPADLEAMRARLTPLVYKRARHVVTENERTLQFAKALQAGDWEKTGKLMYESHESLRDDYAVSCSELDHILDISRQLGSSAGVIGCRMTGAGFGGCAVCLARTANVQVITRRIGEAYEHRTNTHAAMFSSRPAGGARVIK